LLEKPFGGAAALQALAALAATSPPLIHLAYHNISNPGSDRIMVDMIVYIFIPVLFHELFFGSNSPVS
jgi:hypothetical protein